MNNQDYYLFVENYRDVLESLVLAGFTTMMNGSITIHYDNNGVIQKIENRQIHLTRKKN